MTTTSNNYKYNKYIDEYIFLVESNQIVTNKDIRAAIEIVKEKLNQPNVFIDNEKIEKAIDKIHKFFDFEFLPWEKFILGLIHCYYDDGTVVWDEFLLEMGRGSGKNGFISALSWYFTTNIHGIKEYNVDIVANCEDQAKTSFDDVYNIIDENKKLQSKFKYNQEIIKNKKTKSYIRFRTSNAKTKDGLRPGVVVFDEIHEYEEYSQIKVFKSALGKKKNPRTFYITTNGYLRGGVLDDFLEEAKDILSGEDKESRMLPLLYHIEDKKEIHDIKMWEKANPSLRYFPDLLATMKSEYKKTFKRPQMLLEFLTKRMNLPAQDAYTAVAEWEKILATNQEIPDLLGSSCIGAFDFASVRDFASVGLLFKYGEKRVWLHHTFICHKALEIPNREMKFDVRQAEKDGLCTILQTDSINPKVLVEWFIEQSEKYNIVKIYGDRYRRLIVESAFKEYGIPVEFVPTGYITYNILYPFVEKLFADENIIYGDDKMMRWYTNNTYVKIDKRGNRTYEKIEPILRKTDGFFALLLALSKDAEIPQFIKPVILDCFTY